MIIVSAPLAALFLTVQGLAVTFASPPQEVSAKIAGFCIERGHQVIEMNANLAKCEIALTNEQKGHLLFTRFLQRNYTSQVRQFVSFTVVPTSTGSIVQPRQWLEAIINGETRTVEIRGDNEAGIRESLVSLGGTPR